MARQFNGSTQFLASAAALSDLDPATRFAVGFWLDTTYANDDDMVLELSANSNTTPGAFKIIANDSGASQVHFSIRDTSGNTRTILVPAPTTGWHHFLFVAQPGVSPGLWAYIDGVAISASPSGPSLVDLFGNHTLYVMSRAGASLHADGKMADLCIWTPASSNLTATEAAELFAGARANTVRTSDIAYYWPLAGDAAPEPATVGSTALAVTGATATDDPPDLGAAPEMEPLEFTAVRSGPTTATITWTNPGDIPSGVHILRAPGEHAVDGSGNAFGEDGYDPETIPDAAFVTSNELSPYNDGGLDPDTAYTYAIIRSATIE